jgi:hypothetical protein
LNICPRDKAPYKAEKSHRDNPYADFSPIGFIHKILNGP